MRVTRTLLAAVGAAAAAATFVSAPAEAHQIETAPSCEVKRLPEPDGKNASIAYTIDSTASHVGGRVYADNADPDLRIWHGDTIEDPGIGSADTYLQEINASGTAVGGRPDDAGDGFAAWIYKDGKVSDLPGVAGKESFARAVNDSGDVVGIIGNFISPERPVIWRDGAGKPVDLPLPDGAKRGEAFDLSADGTAVGWYEDGAGVRHSYMWDADGTGKELPVPEGEDPAKFSHSARAISGDWIIGLAEDAGYPMIWRPGSDHAERLDMDWANDVNSHGWVVGDNNGRAALLTEDGLTELPGIADHDGSGFELANQITDDGVIAGQAVDKADKYHAVVWTCS